MSREARRRRRKTRYLLLTVVALIVIGFLLHNQVLNVFAPKPSAVIYHVDTPQKAVSFTFDVVWEPAEVAEILDILDLYDVCATFFLTGAWLRNNPDLAREMIIRGHEIGQHTQNHKRLTELDDEQTTKEFDLMEETLQEELNMQVHIFRPPFGEVDQRVSDYAASRGYTTVIWSINPHDWLDPGAEKIAGKVLSNIHNGAVILFHTSSTQTTQALPMIIESLRMKEYSIVEVTQLLHLAGTN